MSGSNVVIVESPAKAKTINKYLGDDYTVIASYGHVRDLPAKDGSVRPDEDFAMSWELGDRSKRHIDEIAQAIRGAKHVFLATDPDREGEAIAWHVQEVLRDRKLLNAVDVRRVTFNEITKGAVLDAMRNPRELNRELIDAYLARRALDYLVGFTLSPVLWRKLPGSRSAGRVQSVALRLVCERESEIETFKPQEYWSIEVTFVTPAGVPFTARLIELDGKKLGKFALGEQGAAEATAARVRAQSFAVASVDRRQARRNPWPPFTTSTLQQEASRKLGFGATRTMRTAQKLYEGCDIGGETVGLITYMRTDGVQLSQEAIGAVRSLIAGTYGNAYLPDSQRHYKTTTKNAQEAHEAIRPTDLFRRPEDVARYLESDELRLYDLVWKRTVASQMASAVLDQVAVDIASPGQEIILRATGSIVTFEGFLKVYQESRDDQPDAQGPDTDSDDDKERRLPALAVHDALGTNAVKPNQHFTQPQPRYTEASLVKKLEELGIGRPSTYASTLQVLQDRSYVRLDKKRFVPEDRGRLVTSFLASFFERYVEYGFTAALETKLDDVSDGRLDWKTMLRDFWGDFSTAVDGTRELTITQVIDALDAELGPHFFPSTEGRDLRVCPQCAKGRLGLKLSRTGAFIGCSNYPECRYTRPLAVPGEDGADGGLADGPRELGPDPDTGLPVSVRRGPYGAYIQLGPLPGSEEPPEAKPEAKPAKGKSKDKDNKPPKPKRVSVPRGLAIVDLDLDTALRLLALPRDVGTHPETQEAITAGIGRFGPYLKHGTVYKSLAADDDVLTIGLNRAVVLLAEAKGKAAAAPGKVLGDHPKDGKPVSLHSGRYGPYVRHGKIMASLPRGQAAEEFTLAQAVELIAAKAASTKGAKGTKAATAEKPAKAPAARRTKAAAAEPVPEADTPDAPAKPARARKAAKPAATATGTTADAPVKPARKRAASATAEPEAVKAAAIEEDAAPRKRAPAKRRSVTPS
ncbi:MAG: type I DNA topoisomerase [Azospirillaceae bacterium]|nr:type I DNA topoisomerase [Azospirillaceae bacterium]